MSDNPSRRLSAAAENVRAFNHDSHDMKPGWQYPPNAYDAIGSLSTLAGTLEQAVRQSVWPVIHTFEQGRIRLDGGGVAARAVRELVAARNDAQAAAAALAAAVQRMHNAVSPMGLDTTGLPEFEDDEGRTV